MIRIPLISDCGPLAHGPRPAALDAFPILAVNERPLGTSDFLDEAEGRLGRGRPGPMPRG